MVDRITDEEMYPRTFQLSRTRVPAEGTGQFELAAAGKHPKCKLISAQAITRIHNTTATQLAIEHEDGGNVATATSSATVGTPVAFTVAPAAGYSAVFERNEPIIVIASVEGNAANATEVTAVFETLET